ncbi:ParB N-terminal domain-containing protein [Streptomyces odontomachi]|uniref:ParB N-terminal domain-containing protein n=1 Tax=Streptomyces odontomachi TaxID=2944940 RepID=UPI00210D80D0|nr:ParB N-terminal domain-containing protein [Streptomyces sp. ODS25]
MSKYRGEMPVTLLNDQQIRPTEYRRWRDAHHRFAGRQQDRETVEQYKAEIQDGGLTIPITLGIDDRHHDVYVGDGHHRAVALMQLGAETFPFHWYWIRSFGVRIEHEPFPYHLLGLPQPTTR